LIWIFRWQCDHPSAQRRIRHRRYHDRIGVQREIHELAVAFALGKFIHIAGGHGIKLIAVHRLSEPALPLIDFEKYPPE
jgi:hypothetical protein